MSPVAGIPPDVQNISGPLLLTLMLASLLYGVLVVQVYIYYMAFPKDRKLVKGLVYTVFTLDTTQTVIFFHHAFAIFGAGFGDMDALTAIRLFGFAVPILTGLVSLIVQTFYAYQIRVVSRSWFLSLVILPVATAQSICAIIEGANGFQIRNTDFLQKKTLVPCTIWLVGSALCDTIIAVAMTFYLLRAGSGFKRLAPIISRLVRLFIETGSLTASVAIIDAVLFIAVRKYPFYDLPSGCLVKVYSNTLMVILNSRIRIEGSRDEAKVAGPVLYSNWDGKSGVLDSLQFAPNPREGRQDIVVSLVGSEEISSRSEDQLQTPHSA